MIKKVVYSLLLFSLLLAACTANQASSQITQDNPVSVLASTSFLADITQNVAGDRLVVDTLLPLGVDPHTFQPRPADAAKVAASYCARS